MKKLFFIILLSLHLPLYTQTQTRSGDYSTADESRTPPPLNGNPSPPAEGSGGWYWANHFLFRYNYFGATFLTRLYYKHPILREKDSFWFKDSFVSAGIEQELSAYTRTAAVLEIQPVIAWNFVFKLIYEGALVKSGRPVLVENGVYNIALPPFTGLNPMTESPRYVGGNTLIFQFSPTLTIGGPAGPGMLAFFYTPNIYLTKAYGVGPNETVYYAKENIVMKGLDVLFQHTLRLGYQIGNSGVGVALDVDLVHVLSKGLSLERVGIFAALGYEKPLRKTPELSPFLRFKVGTWLVDKYVPYNFTLYLDTGLKWKFK